MPRRKNTRTRSRPQQDIFKGAIRAISEIVSSAISAIARPFRTRLTRLQEQQRQQLRHDLKILKKQGLLPSEFDIRNAKSTRNLRRLRQRYADVIQGEARTHRIPETAARELRKEGYKVSPTAQRVVLPRGYTVSKSGAVKTTATKSRPSYYVKRVAVQPDMKPVIDAAFASQQRGDLYAFNFNGVGNSYRIFGSAEEMYNYVLSGYPGAIEGKATHITIFRVKDVNKYLRDAEKRTAQRDERKREYDRRRQREKSAAKRGIFRVSRGR